MNRRRNRVLPIGVGTAGTVVANMATGGSLVPVGSWWWPLLIVVTVMGACRG